MQIDMKFIRRATTTHLTPKKEARYTDFSNPSIISGKSRLLRDCSPGHLEFWFFGWSPKHYRPNFPLHPLPAFIAIPYILKCIKEVRHDLLTPYPIIVDIRPEFETMIIKQRKYNRFTQVFPFLSKDFLDQLKRTAYTVAVDSSFEDEYPDHLHSAFEKAYEYYQIYDDRKDRDGSYKRNRRLRKRDLSNQE